MNLVEAITNKLYGIADEILKEELSGLVASKLHESKKRIAADMSGNMYAQTERQRKLRMDVLEDKAEEPKVTQSTEQEVSEEELKEARIAIVKARIRGGKIQRRKKVSNVPGFTMRGGQLTRMSASERRRRKLGAKKAARKTRTKKTQMLRKRRMSLMKRKRLGI
jgi:hypothetical protein